jgi:hypothetical protein
LTSGGDPWLHLCMNTKKATRFLSLALGLAIVPWAAGLLSAHEGHAHSVMGTIAAVHADMKHVEVKTKDGKTSGFYVDDATKFTQGTNSLSLSDLKPGQRVVVSGRTEGTKLIATTVKVGAAGKTAAPAKPAAPHH